MATDKTMTMLGVLTVALMASTPALAQETCSFPAPDPYHHAMDNFVWDYWRCDPAVWQDYDTRFQLSDGENWEGYGLHEKCNLDLPYARTLNALYLVQHSAPASSVGTGKMNTGWSYLDDKIPRIGAGCTCDSGCVARYSPGFWPFALERVQVFTPFYYSRTVSHRAAVLIHEARHDEKSHNESDSACGSGGSCDSDWAYDGSNRWHISWLSDFEVWGNIRNQAMRDDAVSWANYLIDNRFKYTPDLKHVPGVGLKQKCYPNCVVHTCQEYGLCGTYPSCYNCNPCYRTGDSSTGTSEAAAFSSQDGKAGSTGRDAPLPPPECML
ncbi:hypothetical protein [Myxococcus sp. RHSTA-1-4]|uniref:hypothetical protein n=1 Tax=Myxococcus sp. RHSTA-1-4 TaxID=2874601 RepID=UPI001CBF2CC6|nr:hypothetical protein [Myxococcus sp. RHSTA-1-4]MBZ4422957.1 hypothetical protein [Myxococcus sp. RHSTA-1-4]